MVLLSQVGLDIYLISVDIFVIYSYPLEFRSIYGFVGSNKEWGVYVVDLMIAVRKL